MPSLLPQQMRLLSTFVRASLRLSDQRRQPILARSAFNGSQNYALSHPAIPVGHPGAYPADVEVLADQGLIQLRRFARHVAIDVSPAGFELVAQQRQTDVDEILAVECEFRTLLDPSILVPDFDDALARWRKAESLLWTSIIDADLTAIGHHCREALQAFAAALEERVGLPGGTSDPSKTIVRIRSVLDLRLHSNSIRVFSEALLGYWGAVSDLAQRQEHGAGKEGQTLGWDDARRLVFQTLVVMYEIQNAIGFVR